MSFRSALIWHMEQHGTGITELARGAGLTRGVVTQLLRRDTASTSVDNALAIAAYYGETIEQFLRCATPNSGVESLIQILTLLSPSEISMLEAQVRGIIRSRA